jgi:hypothetical protein
MAYALGAVKPHVKKAAEYFGQKHGYSVVYGWRAVGSVPNSDHPKGLALDFMGSNKAKGDALATDALAQKATFGITYVIWRRRINKGAGWEYYDGPSDHYDHVHISFGETAGSINTVPVGNPLVPDWAEQIRLLVGYIETGLKWLVEPSSWARISMFGVGFILVVVALVSWQTVKSAVTKAGKYAKS